MSKKPGLGRNLNALLGGGPRLLNNEEAKIRVGKVLEQIPLSALQAGEYQPRSNMDEDALKDLATSIKEHGVMQPIIARPVQGYSDKYEIIAGERRVRAARLAGLKTVPVLLRDVPDQAALAMALIENVQREDLTPLEEAQAFKRLMNEFGLTHQQVSEAVGKSRPTVSNMLRLLNLQEAVQIMLERGEIELGHAKALLALNGEKQVQVAREIILRQLTVRAAEKFIKSFEFDEKEASKLSKQKIKDPNIQYYQERLQSRLPQQPITIDQGSSGGGKIIIKYKKLSELDFLLEAFK